MLYFALLVQWSRKTQGEKWKTSVFRNMFISIKNGLDWLLKLSKKFWRIATSDAWFFDSWNVKFYLRERWDFNTISFSYFTLDKMMLNTRAIGSDRNKKIIIFS